MLIDVNEFKNKAKSLMFSSLIFQGIAILISVILFLNQKMVFRMYAGDLDGFALTPVMIVVLLSELVCIFVLFAIYYVLLTQAVEVHKGFAIAFACVYIILTVVVFPLVTNFMFMRTLMTMGNVMITSFSAMRSAVEAFTRPFTVIAAALFFMSCGVVIASDCVGREQYGNQGINTGV